MAETPELSVATIAEIIRRLSVEQLLELRRLLNEGGDPAGVGAVIPPELPLDEGSVAQPIPPDYWESAE
jgi:hypothetical protein